MRLGLALALIVQAVLVVWLIVIASSVGNTCSVSGNELTCGYRQLGYVVWSLVEFLFLALLIGLYVVMQWLRHHGEARSAVRS